MRRIAIISFILLICGCYNNTLIRSYGLKESFIVSPNEVEACEFKDVENVHSFFQKIKRGSVVLHGREVAQAGIRRGRSDWDKIFGKKQDRDSKNIAVTQRLETVINEDFEKCKEHYLQHFKEDSKREYYLSFIEYDDQGQLRNRDQLDNIVWYFRDKFSPRHKIGAAKSEVDPNIEGPGSFDSSVIMIVYIHGWHHGVGYTRSGKNDDTDIQHFRHLLRLVSESESSSKNPRKVLGVYIGWRGESIGIPGINKMTFWGRKRVAHNIGTIGITETLLKLENLVHGSGIGRNSSDNGGTRNRFVLIGHSFGAAIAMSGVRNILLREHFERFEHFDNWDVDEPHSLRKRRFADLVVLLNPAFEATRLTNIFDISQRYNKETDTCQGYSPDTKPTLISLTSEDDLATLFAFPLGRRVANFFESYQSPDEVNRVRCNGDGIAQRSGASESDVQTSKKPGELPLDDSQQAVSVKGESNVGSDGNGWLYIPKEADRTAYGHYKWFVTHRLETRHDSLLRLSVDDNRGAALPFYWKRQKSGKALCFGYVKLKHEGNSHPYSPYLNVSMSGDVSSGHNDIWNIKILSFLHSMIQLSLSGNGRVVRTTELNPHVDRFLINGIDVAEKFVELHRFDSDCYPEKTFWASRYD